MRIAGLCTPEILTRSMDARISLMACCPRLDKKGMENRADKPGSGKEGTGMPCWAGRLAGVVRSAINKVRDTAPNIWARFKRSKCSIDRAARHLTAVFILGSGVAGPMLLERSDTLEEIRDALAIQLMDYVREAKGCFDCWRCPQYQSETAKCGLELDTAAGRDLFPWACPVGFTDLAWKATNTVRKKYAPAAWTSTMQNGKWASDMALAKYLAEEMVPSFWGNLALPLRPAHFSNPETGTDRQAPGEEMPRPDPWILVQRFAARHVKQTILEWSGQRGSASREIDADTDEVARRSPPPGKSVEGSIEAQEYLLHLVSRIPRLGIIHPRYVQVRTWTMRKQMMKYYPAPYVDSVVREYGLPEEDPSPISKDERKEASWLFKVLRSEAVERLREKDPAAGAVVAVRLLGQLPVGATVEGWGGVTWDEEARTLRHPRYDTVSDFLKLDPRSARDAYRRGLAFVERHSGFPAPSRFRLKGAEGAADTDSSDRSGV